MTGQEIEENPSTEPEKEKQEWMNRDTRRIVGEVIILLIYLVFDVVEVWPGHPILALAGGVAGISALALKELTTRMWIVTTTLAAIIAATIWTEAPKNAVSTIADQPKLSINSLKFAKDAPLQTGPINLEAVFVNSGKGDALVTEGKTTPALASNGAKLPDKPQYPKRGRVMRQVRIIPGTPQHVYSETNDMVLKQTDVDSIKAGTERLYWYGYMKYGAHSEYAFISVYDPRVNAFVWDGDEYPTYARAE